MKIETMVVDMIVGTTEWGAAAVAGLSEEQEIGTVMTVGSTTMLAEVSVSSAECLRVGVGVVVEEEEEVGDGPGPDPHHADGVVPDRLPAVTVAATTMPTIGETTGSVLSVFSVILHEGLSV